MLSRSRGNRDAGQTEHAQDGPLARVGVLHADERDDEALAPHDAPRDVQIVVGQLVAPAGESDGRQHDQPQHQRERVHDKRDHRADDRHLLPARRDDRERHEHAQEHKSEPDGVVDAPDDFDFGVELMRRKFSHGRPRHRRVSGNARPSYQRTAHPSPALPQVRFLRIPFSRRSSIRTTHDSHPQAARRTTARIRLEPKTLPSAHSSLNLQPLSHCARKPLQAQPMIGHAARSDRTSQPESGRSLPMLRRLDPAVIRSFASFAAVSDRTHLTRTLR